MNSACDYKYCKNSKTRNATLSFFKIPHNNYRKLWKKHCGIKKAEDDYHICHEHFYEKDLITKGFHRSRRENAVPISCIGCLCSEEGLSRNCRTFLFKCIDPWNKVCIVKGCNKKGYLVYPFPRDKHRETQWLTSFMPKDGFTMDAKYGVCSVHFRDGDFYANSMRLKCNAVPSLELIDPQIELRSSENREETLESEVNVQQEPIEEICENVSGPYDTIPNFNSLVSNYKIHLKENLLAKFFIEKNDNFLSFCKLHFESTGQVSVQNSVTISTNLMVTVYLEGKQVEQQQEDPVNLPCNNKLRNFSQLKDILEGLLETRSYGLLTSSTFRNSLTLSVYAIEEILNERQMPLDEETEDIVHHISVVRDQLKQIQDNTNEFSEDTVAICWKINNTSSKAYEYLRELLFLPDPEQLKKFVEPDSSLADESQMEICDMDEEFSVPEEKVNSYADVFVKDLDEIDEM